MFRSRLLAIMCLGFVALAGASACAASPEANGKIAFVSDRDGERDGDLDIYVMNADGTDQTNLTNDPANNINPQFSFSPDGTKIAFVRYRGNSEVYVMDTDGSNPTNLTNNLMNDIEPAFSLDGTKITFTSDRDGSFERYMMDTDGTNQTRLTDDPVIDARTNNVSPDGTKIAAIERNPDGDCKDNEIYVANSDGTDSTKLTNNDASDGAPAFLPDGKIAFVSERDGNLEIYAMNSDGTEQTNLTNNDADDSFYAVSPDGTKIAFVSDRDGNEEVYVMNSDGTDQIRLTYEGGSRPVFSPDGTW